MKDGKKILVVDDDMAIAQLVSDALEDEGFEVKILGDGMEAYEVLSKNHDYSLVILDIMMPKMDGLELCYKIRDTVGCPIMFVTAKNRTIDTLVGLDIGGDDYIYKPFVVEELVARAKAHIRRDSRNGFETRNGVIKIGEIELRTASYEALRNGEAVSLSTREFQLLQYLMENSGRVLTREQIFNSVWGTNYGDIGTVAVNIKNLRSKIDPDSEYIKTVWGVGYKFAHE
ncbi:MAG: response regulator transcription factor [Oscillospiraceae bacterium]|jgi:DNA-binding response OmpR family regulator|nr:response regulator transcription factor [Oscillospiraceae bacterium]